MEIHNIHEAKTNSRLVERVRRGEEIIIGRQAAR